MTAKAAQKISLWEFFQQLGKTFMLPVALLSFCGIMLDPVPWQSCAAGCLHLDEQGRLLCL